MFSRKVVCTRCDVPWFSEQMEFSTPLRMLQKALNGFIRKSLKEIMSKSRREQDNPSSLRTLQEPVERGTDGNKKKWHTVKLHNHPFVSSRHPKNPRPFHIFLSETSPPLVPSAAAAALAIRRSY